MNMKFICPYNNQGLMPPQRCAEGECTYRIPEGVGQYWGQCFLSYVDSADGSEPEFIEHEEK